MGDNIIDNRRMIRQRFDLTALHKTKVLDAGDPIDVIRLDVVSQKITVELGALTAHVYGSLNGIDFVQIGIAATGQFTHGDVVGDMLVKWVKIERTLSTDSAVIIGA